MNLRDFLAWWLRGLRATAVTVDEALTQRRLHARDDDDELARDIAELQALQSAHEPVLVPVPLTVSLEALWERPTVTPDLRGYTYLDVAVPAMRRWVDCNTPGVTCHSYYDFERPPQPAVPASLGGSL